MFRLCFKDFYVNRILILLTFIYFIFGFSAFFLLEQRIVEPALLLLIIIAIIMNTDEKYKTNALICSLPVKRAYIVLSRYFSSLIIIIIGIGIGATIISILKPYWSIGFPFKGSGWTYGNWFSVLFPLTFTCCIVFPFYFRFGYSKGWMIGLVTASFFQFGIFYIVSSVYNGYWGIQKYIENSEKPIFSFIVGIINQGIVVLGKPNTIIILSLTMIPIVIVSITLSIKFFNRREV